MLFDVAVDGDHIQFRFRGGNGSEGFPHTVFGQVTLNGDQRVFRMLLAKLRHIGQLLTGNTKRRLHGRCAVNVDKMLSKPLGEGGKLGLFNRGDGNEGCSAEGFQPQPAVGKGLTCLAGQVGFGPVGKLEAAGQAPFAGTSRGKKTLRSLSSR